MLTIVNESKNKEKKTTKTEQFIKKISINKLEKKFLSGFIKMIHCQLKKIVAETDQNEEFNLYSMTSLTATVKVLKKLETFLYIYINILASSFPFRQVSVKNIHKYNIFSYKIQLQL